MFEYLMPLLVMPTYENTLLDQTYRAAVRRQIEYGAQRGVPWGISESGYNAVDAGLNYQYRAFGVPGLGLKRGLAEDLVVAPYASALALMVAPEAACQNLQRLAGDGLDGPFGFYEAIDYTPSRAAARPDERRRALVHGASPGHEPAVARLPAAGPADAAALRRRSAVPGDDAAAAGADPEGHRDPFARTAEARSTRTRARAARRCRCACFTNADTAIARGAAALQRPLPRDGHERGRRLQPLEGPRGHALARGRDLRQLGQLLLPARRRERRVLVERVPADARSAPTATRRSSREARAEFRRRDHDYRDAHGDRRLARGRHRAAAGPHHQPLPRAPARSR